MRLSKAHFIPLIQLPLLRRPLKKWRKSSDSGHMSPEQHGRAHCQSRPLPPFTNEKRWDYSLTCSAPFFTMYSNICTTGHRRVYGMGVHKKFMYEFVDNYTGSIFKIPFSLPVESSAFFSPAICCAPFLNPIIWQVKAEMSDDRATECSTNSPLNCSERSKWPF